MNKKLLGALVAAGVVAVATYAMYQVGGERLALLDEKIETIRVSKSTGLGLNNEESVVAIEEVEQIAVLEAALRNAKLQSGVLPEAMPEYDLMVEYQNGLPSHPLHLWLGEEGEEALVTYTVNYEEVYKISAKDADEIRKVIR